MHVLIENNLTAIAELCKKHNVKTLYLFGSATTDEFDPQTSDLDFLVEFEPFQLGERSRHFFELQKDLEQLFNHSVDLGEPQGIRNEYIRQSIETSKVPVYAAA